MKRRLLTIGLTLLLAAVGTISVLLYVRNADARALAGKRAVPVVVAQKRVPAGTTAGAALRNGLLRLEKMPAETVPQNALGEIGADVTELVATADVQAGQLLLKPMFAAAKPASSGLPIPEGKVAVSIELGAPQRVAGYVKAGSQIAVFDTYTVMDEKSGTPSGAGLEKQHESTQVTRLLLPKVEVLALGAPPVPNAKQGDGASQGGVLVTVAVTQGEAERLIQRAQFGTLHFALLTDSSQISQGNGTNSKSVFGPA
ncbi:Flp pilus assembly protein CpaB [Lentzea aerocolonigenes]|uniref:Flp pilus assembly protein CpaB n=1 Tax=Lentzea aerocolonigenes TaxID=68170 RepID=UPI0006893F87|nr:Flp pilus assembly protein CpaB [Lentzea aerocolonigenes]MCP2243584.1 pilus assembly protein CpaB [Lentzea aerocolonigenes]